MLGEKTRRLGQLAKAGFRVPGFVSISTADINRASHELARQALSGLDGSLFAVRSSALVEDAAKSSMAGQFLTRLAVPRAELSQAIDEVRTDAHRKLGSLKEFSLIIQEFIEPDYSGVAFTRNPNGERDLVIEYHRGRGDAVVSGEVRPIRESVYRAQEEVASTPLKIAELRTQFFNIEKLFGFPQDIEWCIRGSELFILQSRPITSLSPGQIDALNRLEQALPSGKFYLAKTEVCDVAPRPSKATFELLQAMYAEGGPVQRAYHELGVEFFDTSFLLLINGELFVDKEKELQSLLPSHSYLFSSDYKMRPVRLKGFLTSLRNTRRLASIGGDLESLRAELRKRLELPFSKVSYKTATQAFFDDYTLIFKINLLAQHALRTLQQVLPRDIGLSQALTCFPSDLAKPWQPPQGLAGNTLDFSDHSLFVAVLGQAKVALMPKNLPLIELRQAQEYLRLREYGRWLALRHINRLRGLVTDVKNSANPNYSAPTILTDRPVQLDARLPLGVSAGQVTGRLVSKPEAGGILVVSALTPDLANHLGQIKGVIADHGGLLSHFAIIAREAHLPVIVNYPIQDLKIEAVVSLDGATGEVVVLESGEIN